MAVAEKPLAEGKVPRSPYRQLAVGSLLGGLYVLFSLGMVFAGIPWLWEHLLGIKNEFLSGALMLLVDLLAVVGFFFLGRRLEGRAAPRGRRAGVFFVCLFIIVLVLIGKGVAMLAGALFEEFPILGAVATLGVMAALAFTVGLLFLLPGFALWLGELEDGGWFHATSYKPNQGVRVRRVTVIALLVLGICGIITLISHKSLGTELRYEGKVLYNDWIMSIPFVGGDSTLVVEIEALGWEIPIPFLGEQHWDYYLPILYKVHYTVPLILLGLLIWVAWRIVNWPTFADFLIATEAEINKVSWTTRKRLVQDTVVVLVTVFLLTAFLFFVDILWIKVLSLSYTNDRGDRVPIIGVLQVDPKEAMQKQQEKTQW
jgi:preprotein translocase SecE subunit